jgi:two-component system cell cycle response regulator
LLTSAVYGHRRCHKEARVSVTGRVLVVDGDSDRAAGLADRLSRHGYSSVISETGQDALPIAFGGGADIVLVAADSAGDAAMLATALGQRSGARSLPVVLLTFGNVDAANDDPSDAGLLGRLRAMTRLTTIQNELFRRVDTAERFGVDVADIPTPPDTINDARLLMIGGDQAEQGAVTTALHEVAAVVPMANAYAALQKLATANFDAAIVALDKSLIAEFCRDIRYNPRLYNFPLIALVPQRIPELLADGTSETILKPWAKAELSERVVALVRQQRYRDALLRLYKQIRHAATADMLTGLYNHGFLLDHLGTQIAAARRNGKALTLACLAVANLAEVNRAHGYAAGDRLLRQVGSLIANLVRAEDLPARHSGAAFCISMTDTETAVANVAIRRIMGIVNQTSFALTNLGEPVAAVLSNSIVGLETSDTPESLIARARARLA